MTRTCGKCGLLEARETDARGLEVTNLDPVSGLCIDCLCLAVKAKRMPAGPVPFDARQRQTGEPD